MSPIEHIVALETLWIAWAAGLLVVLAGVVRYAVRMMVEGEEE